MIVVGTGQLEINARRYDNCIIMAKEDMIIYYKDDKIHINYTKSRVYIEAIFFDDPYLFFDSQKKEALKHFQDLQREKLQ